jgi:uncharacterized protein (TIGR02145 family)
MKKLAYLFAAALMKKIYISILASICALTGFAQTATTDPGVVINSVTWATRNVDAPGTFAASPESTGMFYQWNRKIGWSSADPLVSSNGGTTWNKTTPTPSIVVWEEANDPCPDGWRVPTQTELQSLRDAGSVWISDYNNSGISGRVFGIAPHTIFLPAAAGRNIDGQFASTDHGGNYWSSTSANAYATADRLFFDNNGVYMTDYSNRMLGFSIRCVSENSVAAINEISANKLQVFIDNEKLTVKNVEIGVNVWIVDISGRTVGTTICPQTMDVSHLLKGIYFVQISKNGKSLGTVKIIKK